MSRASASIGNVLDGLLAEACERNAPAELLFARPEGQPVTARVRLLELTDEHILADRPGQGDQTQQIPPGRTITVHLVIRGARYQFESAIVDLHSWVQLNSEQRVPGIVLNRPTEITRSERRSDFRVSLAGLAPISVEMARGDPEIQDACLIEPSPVCGRMLNLSAGGAALLLDLRSLRSSKRGERFFMTFSLPGIEKDFCLLGEVRHALIVEASESIRLAMAFRQWGGRRFGQDERLITKFITERQRRLLRLRK